MNEAGFVARLRPAIVATHRASHSRPSRVDPESGADGLAVEERVAAHPAPQVDHGVRAVPGAESPTGEVGRLTGYDPWLVAVEARPQVAVAPIATEPVLQPPLLWRHPVVEAGIGNAPAGPVRGLQQHVGTSWSRERAAFQLHLPHRQQVVAGSGDEGVVEPVENAATRVTEHGEHVDVAQRPTRLGEEDLDEATVLPPHVPPALPKHPLDPERLQHRGRRGRLRAQVGEVDVHVMPDETTGPRGTEQ